MIITVIGAGAWGTALARLLLQNGHAVTLWANRPEQALALRNSFRNERYLPGIDLPQELRFADDLPAAVKGSEGIVIAVPSKYLRNVISRIPDFHGLAITVTKGIEFDTGLTMAGVIESVMPKAKVAALSGPTLALEIARGIPAAIVAAHPDGTIAREVQSLFHRNNFRVYTSADLIGVELGGALKNVVAVAAGISDGLGFGDNAKAAIVTRAIAEIRRLGVAGGAHPETFSGLSGLGDLTVTCFSKLSRNRAFGERIGRGETVEKICADSITVAEGYPTARSAAQLARKLGVSTPIIDQVHAMLYEKKNARQAVTDLMTREMKEED